MKKLVLISLWLVMITSHFYCKPKASLQVKYKGELQSRRSYAAIQGMKDEETKNDYIYKVQNSNPVIYDFADSNLVAFFIKAGLAVKDSFLLSKFNTDTAANTTFITAAGNKYPLTFYTDTTSGTTHFTIKDGNRIIDIDTEAHTLQQLDYAFLDILPGGNKELIFLDDYYIMNGDNFHLKVYEITAP